MRPDYKNQKTRHSHSDSAGSQEDLLSDGKVAELSSNNWKNAKPCDSKRNVRARLMELASRVRKHGFSLGSRDKMMMIFTVFYFFCCMYITCLANAYADQNGVNPNSMVKTETKSPAPPLLLNDPGMNALADLHRRLHLSLYLPDYFVAFAVVSVIVLCMVSGKRALIIARRALIILATAFLLRAPTVLMTVLPYPFKECDRKPIRNIPLYALELLFMQHVSCGDVFFSGHSLEITLSALFWLKYSKSKLLAAPVVAIAILGLFSTVSSRYHYSIDVFFGTLVITVLSAVYHWIAEGKVLQNAAFGRFVRFIDCELFYNNRKQAPSSSFACIFESPSGSVTSSSSSSTLPSTPFRFDESFDEESASYLPIGRVPK